MSDSDQFTERFKRYHVEDNEVTSGSKSSITYENDSVPLIADGHIFVSRKEFKRRTGIKEGTLSRYRQMNVIPASAYKMFDHYNPPESRYFEEYVLLIEENKRRKERFDTQQAFYEFINQKWGRHKHELINQVPTDWR